MLSQLGDEAKVLAGGQSLIPLMKLRFANPQHLVDLNFVPNTSYIQDAGSVLRFGAMTRHAEIEDSAAVRSVPILHDCAAGIADVQVRNRGTIGGSIAEADPSGDWATVLLTQETQVWCIGPSGKRSIPLSDFIKDAYTTSLAQDELVEEIAVSKPPSGTGSAYLAFKRAAPVYPTASVAIQLTLQGDSCKDVAIALGCVGLTAVRASRAEQELRGQTINDRTIDRAADAVQTEGDPQGDMRGSAEYKRKLLGGLLKRAIGTAVRRARGEQVETSHIYA